MPATPNDLFPRLASEPRLYPHQLEMAQQALLLVLMSREELRAASFLDQRCLTPQTQGKWFSLGDVLKRVGPFQPKVPVHYIFHMGHTGSTLVSRLLDETGEVLGLREPLPLRTLAEVYDQMAGPTPPLNRQAFQTLTEMLRRLWARPFGEERATIVKATSHTARVGAHLLTSAPDSKAIYLVMGPDDYMATILAGAHSLQDLTAFADERLARLRVGGHDVPQTASALAPGELAAMTWAAEHLTASALASGTETSSRVQVIDFDAFLADPAPALHSIAAHFGLSLTPEDAERIISGPVMSAYSKDPDQKYTAELRRQVMAQSAAEHEADIQQGASWLRARGLYP